MKYEEIIAGGIPLNEMAFTRQKAESIIEGMEGPLNLHLIKMVAVVDPDGTKSSHWYVEITNWLDEIAEIRLKPNRKFAPARFYFDILFDQRFGGTETESAARRLRRLSRSGYTLKDDLDPMKIASALKEFHMKFAELASNGAATDDTVAVLISKFAATNVQ